jgi:hypothetical protein
MFSDCEEHPNRKNRQINMTNFDLTTIIPLIEYFENVSVSKIRE